MITVHWDDKKLIAAFKRIPETVQQRRDEFLDVLGIELLSLQQRNFRDKSRGGAGSDGVTWKPLSPATERKKAKRGRRSRSRVSGSQIGVDTGLLQLSITQVISGDQAEVTVGYIREYAEFFDAVRPLVPSTLPQEWASEIDDLAQDWIDMIANETLRDVG